jgi:hypothetical protein
MLINKREKMKKAWIALLITLLVIAVFIPLSYLELPSQSTAENSSVYFGVTFGANTTAQAKQLIDKVKDYTNLFIVDSWNLNTLNEAVNGTALTDVCDYAVANGLHVIVYFAFISHLIYPWHVQWIEQANERYGDKLLGIYFFDEPGGKQIDLGSWNNDTSTFANVTNYHEASNRYIQNLSSTQSLQDLKSMGIPAFTSDYALYWFDYLAGFDCVLAQIYGDNQTSKIQQIALCRGAADTQGKQWGAIITWSSKTPPYAENGTVMLEDMQMAYQAGAKYIVVFDYPTYPDNNPYGILTDEHFEAMKSFWNQIHSTQKNTFASSNAQAALVLPKDYGWGARRPSDRIWGLWDSDDLSPVIWSKISQDVATYGLNLDIVYNDTAFNLNGRYPTIDYWNT